VNTSDNRSTLDSTLIGIRHRNNMSNILLYDQSLFYNFDLTTTSKHKSFSFSPNSVYDYSPTSITGSVITQNAYLPGQLVRNFSIPSYLTNLNSIIKDLFFFLYPSFYTSLLTANLSLSYLKSTLLSSLFIPTLVIQQPTILLKNNKQTSLDYGQGIVYNSSSSSYGNYNDLLTSSFADNSTSWRFNRFSYPLISYDYKSGNYLSIWDQLYSSLSLSFIEVARGIRKAPWFFSDQYTDLLKSNYLNFLSKFTTQLNLKLADVDNWNSVNITPLNSFLSIFFSFTKNDTFLNLRWVSVNSLDQKLYTMFNSSSIQQRILSNW
jgi:hypothetical protein